MDSISIFLIVTSLTNLFLAFIIFFNETKLNKINLSFSLLAFNVAIWSLPMIYFRETTTITSSLIASKILYSIPVFIPTIFLYFVLLFKNKQEKVSYEKDILSILFIWSIFLIIGILNTDNFIVNVFIPEHGEKILVFGKMYPIYMAHFIGFFGLSFILLIKKYLKTESEKSKDQIALLFAGTFISSCFGMTTDLILPWFGYFELNWMGNMTTIIFLGFILYTILKYQLFNLKIIATEIFLVFLTIVLFIDIFFSKSKEEFFIKIFIFISVVVMSYLTIKGMYKEIETRKKVEKMAKELQKANAHLKKMDKQKTEFISLASHQLRGPIASLKGYTSMILEGSYGPISKEVEDVINRLLQSSQSLSIMIDDFLSLSRIERGKIDFFFNVADVQDIVERAISEIKPIAKDKGVDIKYKVQKGDYTANIDADKIKQTISNILDNSVKYTPKGSVKLTLSNKKNKILIEISDTGIGIAQKNISKLFRKFKRLKNANSISIKGTGLGLYLAKEVIKAHKGRIWVESKGEGKGTTFFIELKSI